MMRKTSDVMRVEAAQANVEGEQEEEINILCVEKKFHSRAQAARCLARFCFQFSSFIHIKALLPHSPLPLRIYISFFPNLLQHSRLMMAYFTVQISLELENTLSFYSKRFEKNIISKK